MEDKRRRLVRDNEIKEEMRRREEERVRKLEEKLERAMKENKERWKESDERMRGMEDMMEREVIGKAGWARRSKEQSRNMEEERLEGEITNTKERMAVLEDRIREGEKSPGKKDRKAHARIDQIERDIAKDRAERKEFEWNIEEEKGIQAAKDSEKDMEKKLEGAMEQVKILNSDFGKKCADGKTLIKDAVSRIKEKIMAHDKKEFEKIMEGARVDILGKGMSAKDFGRGRIHTVPVLITCGCKNAKGRLEVLVRKAGMVASFQWPKECMEFVGKKVGEKGEGRREKVETMGFSKKEYYPRVRPAVVHGRVLLRVDTKRKVGGKFEGLA